MFKRKLFIKNYFKTKENFDDSQFLFSSCWRKFSLNFNDKEKSAYYWYNFPSNDFNFLGNVANHVAFVNQKLVKMNNN